MPSKLKPPVVDDDPPVRTFDTMPKAWARAPILVAVDPGLNSAGVAVWRDGVLVEATTIKPTPETRKWPWTVRADFVANSIWGRLPEDDTIESTVVCEFPEGFGGVKMMAWKTGDLQRLVYLVGLISGKASPARFVPVLVHTWKGQLPKSIVEHRLRQRLGAATVKRLHPEADAWDAIGIGMWARGEF